MDKNTSFSFSLKRLAGLVAIGGACFFGSAPNASAQAPKAEIVNTSIPRIEILVIHATKCDKKLVDPAITEPPPSAMGFECMKLIERKVVPIAVGQADTTRLPNGRVFHLAHTERVGSRYKLAASINSPDGGWLKLVDVTADPNKKFNVGGWTHQGGVIVLSIKVLP